MTLFTPDERRLAQDIAALAFCNPFLDARLDFEKRVLGDAYAPSEAYWSLVPDLARKANVEAIAARCQALVEAAERRLRDGARTTAEERRLFDDVVIYFLYERYSDAMLKLIERGSGQAGFYAAFRADAARYLHDRIEAAHLFACFHQVRRAFHHIFRNIVGRSRPAAALRAAVWESIFTHDMRRYRRSLYARMADVTTLITGPTGTGKELVARAIGLSRYIPFDERRGRFAGDAAATFVGLNLSARSPTLIESELFGHRKGAFTGAISDREGFLESCGAHGTVFLDEIGEIEPAVQVKLLRVIQTRTFQRLGDTAPRAFAGKLIAATNRDLSEAIRQGRFRDDFYYRLCADTITTPSLREQLGGSEDELRHLVRFIGERVAGEGEVEELTAEVLRAIDRSPGLAYEWPGNFRELEQCVRSVLLRGTYRPATRSATDARQRIAGAVLAGAYTAEDLLRNYTTLLYAKTPNYSHVADQLQVDRRTVRARVDAALLDELKA